MFIKKKIVCKKLTTLLILFLCLVSFNSDLYIGNNIIYTVYADTSGLGAIWNNMNISQNDDDSISFNVGDVGNESTKKDFNYLLSKYKILCMIVTSLLTLTAFLGMIIEISKLSMAGDNDKKRKMAISGIMFSGIGLALMGSATLIIGLLVNS